ncbi:GMC family oxidoreductase [uncultured Imperialibacter sp.]|uniref:GMC family oxidoreductase n=1 Tax=uncultured Imperialibacter sp. TaxID=1672639 RepID=UPI0030D9A58B|tara:strand:- start:1533 stop:3224 length:1692 start_codon:yes stop_codon:yes gene_type:complete
MQDQNSTHQYDAIVVGSGISGGWAAKELCEKGLKTLVLERGRSVKHGEYPTAHQDSWDMPNNGVLSYEEAQERKVQSRTGWIGQDTKHFFVNDKENPYDEVKRFDWIRGYQTGGRSLTWGRQTYRWSDLDFEANAKEGIGVDWPIRYKDIAPWYDYVEKYVGISGEAMGLPHLPDGQFLPPMELNCVEQHTKQQIESNFKNRYLTIGRVTNLTQEHNGRGPCQYRNRCSRGCPFSGYFSSVSSTLPDAEKTGNLTMISNAVVHSIIYDDKTGKATGVRVIDAESKATTEYFAKVIFLNASTMASTFILLNSTSDSYPTGLGNESDQLGRNLMDHHYRVGAIGDFEGFADKYYEGRRPNGIYIPRFRNINEETKRNDYVRGFGYQGGAERAGAGRGGSVPGFGAEFKDGLMEPGPWQMALVGFGECLPHQDNRMWLNFDKKDPYGLPTLTVDAEFRENEMAMRKDMADSAAEMLEASGFKKVETYDSPAAMGLGIHEMGTARMGNDPKTSVLNKWNQVHGAPNVFVTDGSAMTSSACQNPSLTYMALTVRAANYAAEQLKKKNL